MLKPARHTPALPAGWKRLPARERLMLSLLYYEGLTPTETAYALGCTVREVVRAVEAGLDGLRRELEPLSSSAVAPPAAESRRRAA